MPITGNLLPYEVASFESESVVGWDADNAALSILSPGNIINEDGNSILQADADGGPVRLTLEDVYEVPPDTEIVAFGWVMTLSQEIEATISLVFLDEVLEEVGRKSTTEVTPESGTARRQLCASETSPEDARYAYFEVSYSADPESSTYWDQFFLGPSSALYPRNTDTLLTWESYSHTGTVRWESESVDLVRTPYAVDGEVPVINWYLGVSPGSASTSVEIRSTDLIPVTGGAEYQTGALVSALTSEDPGATLRLQSRMDWYTEEGDLLQQGAMAPPQEWEIPTDPGLFAGHQFYTQESAPTGAAFGRPVIVIPHVPGTAPSTYYLGRPWGGLADIQYSLESHQDQGYVSLTVTGPDPGTQNDPRWLTAYRIHPDGSRHLLRWYGGDLDGLDVGQYSIQIEDHEAPLGVRVWYTLEWLHDNEVSTSRLTTRQVQTPVLEDVREVWFKAPHMPARNRRVMVADGLSWTRAARASVFQIVGRSAPIAVTGVRGSREGTLSLYAWTPDDHEDMASLLSTGLPVLMQTVPNQGSTGGNLYLHVEDATESPMGDDGLNPGWIWELSVHEIDRPSGGISGTAGRTWGDVEDDHDTWDSVYSAYDTWAAVLTGAGS